MTLPIIHSDTYKLHAPAFEIWPGGCTTEYFESPQRVEIILDALRSAEWAKVYAPDDLSIDPILAVHDADYVAFIKDGYREWIATNPLPRDGSPPTFYPAYFPPPRWRRKPSGPRQAGGYGYYTFDLTAPLVEGTYAAVVGSAQCAITAANLILNGIHAAYALCRPPGHHAGRDFSGGYCYFQKNAIAPRVVGARRPVWVFLGDFYHGNGKQEIFWKDAQVMTLSLQADPSWEYPYFTGHTEEIGAGVGQVYHDNLPLPRNTGGSLYLHTQR